GGASAPSLAPGWSTTAPSMPPATTLCCAWSTARSCPFGAAAAHTPPPPGPPPFDPAPSIPVGGELKNTFCLASGRDAWMSQHIGDMGSVETLGTFGRTTKQFAEMYGVGDAGVVADMHPGYQTRRWAEDHALGSNAPPVALAQHHHAHIAAVMAEHGVPDGAGVLGGERVIGCAFDGTGYGTDGAIWGGEVLVASYDAFERPHHLRYV